jgi:hypothetical protein
LRALPPCAEAAALLAEWGRNELEEKKVPKWLIFLKMVRAGDGGLGGRGRVARQPAGLWAQTPCNLPAAAFGPAGGARGGHATTPPPPPPNRHPPPLPPHPNPRAQLIQPMPIMIWIAIIIMLALEHWIDFAILMAIQFINAFLGW